MKSIIILGPQPNLIQKIKSFFSSIIIPDIVQKDQNLLLGFLAVDMANFDFCFPIQIILFLWIATRLSSIELPMCIGKSHNCAIAKSNFHAVSS